MVGGDAHAVPLSVGRKIVMHVGRVAGSLWRRSEPPTELRIGATLAAKEVLTGKTGDGEGNHELQRHQQLLRQPALRKVDDARAPTS
ncbi:hypothetical protein CLCR_01353 [Cladophialophora carrionii]|uniref:Uncharacterized protein n=1 Tax=Cladophialophora carrionii TaxID=86049 RepID=A0A1C1CCI8_9EURO|nr:hypothetical protein CLCR_01353 [Cladophialophora carrionii]